MTTMFPKGLSLQDAQTIATVLRKRVKPADADEGVLLVALAHALVLDYTPKPAPAPAPDKPNKGDETKCSTPSPELSSSASGLNGSTKSPSSESVGSCS